MTQIEQLTAIISQARRQMRGVYASFGDVDRAIAKRIIDEGAVLLPCKVGDTVYQTDGDRVYEYTVRRVIYCTDGINFDERAIGESVFLAREGAEEKLERMKS